MRRGRNCLDPRQTSERLRTRRCNSCVFAANSQRLGRQGPELGKKGERKRVIVQTNRHRRLYSTARVAYDAQLAFTRATLF